METDPLVPPKFWGHLEQGMTSLETIPCAGSPQPHHRVPERRGVQLQGSGTVASDGEKGLGLHAIPLPFPFT